MTSPTVDVVSSACPLGTLEHKSQLITKTNEASCSSSRKQTIVKEDLAQLVSTTSGRSIAQAGRQDRAKLSSIMDPALTELLKSKSRCIQSEVNPGSLENAEENGLSSTINRGHKSCRNTTCLEQHSASGTSDFPIAKDAIVACASQSGATMQPNDVSQRSMQKTERVCESISRGPEDIPAQQTSSMSIRQQTTNVEPSCDNIITEGNCCTSELSKSGTNGANTSRKSCASTTELDLKLLFYSGEAVVSKKPLASTSLRKSNQRSSEPKASTDNGQHIENSNTTRSSMHSRSPNREEQQSPKEATAEIPGAATGGSQAVVPDAMCGSVQSVPHSELKVPILKSSLLTSKNATQGGHTKSSQQPRRGTMQLGHLIPEQASMPSIKGNLQQSLQPDSAVFNMSKMLESLPLSSGAQRSVPLSAKVSTPKVHGEIASRTNFPDGTVTSVTPYSRRESTC